MAIMQRLLTNKCTVCDLGFCVQSYELGFLYLIDAFSYIGRGGGMKQR